MIKIIEQWEAYFAHRDALIAAEINAIKQVEVVHETASNAAEVATDAKIAALDLKAETAFDRVFALRDREIRTSRFESNDDYDAFFEKYRGWIQAIQADAIEHRSVIYASAKVARTERWERYSAKREAIEAEFKAKTVSFESFQRTN